MLLLGSHIRGTGLFNKNIGDCKSVTMCTVADACPVPVSEDPVQRVERLVNGGGNRDLLKQAQCLAI